MTKARIANGICLPPLPLRSRTNSYVSIAATQSSVVKTPLDDPPTQDPENGDRFTGYYLRSSVDPAPEIRPYYPDSMMHPDLGDLPAKRGKKPLKFSEFLDIVNLLRLTGNGHKLLISV